MGCGELSHGKVLGAAKTCRLDYGSRVKMAYRSAFFSGQPEAKLETALVFFWGRYVELDLVARFVHDCVKCGNRCISSWVRVGKGREGKPAVLKHAGTRQHISRAFADSQSKAKYPSSSCISTCRIVRLFFVTSTPLPPPIQTYTSSKVNQQSCILSTLYSFRLLDNRTYMRAVVRFGVLHYHSFCSTGGLPCSTVMVLLTFSALALALVHYDA